MGSDVSHSPRFMFQLLWFQQITEATDIFILLNIFYLITPSMKMSPECHDALADTGLRIKSHGTGTRGGTSIFSSVGSGSGRQGVGLWPWSNH